MSIRIKVILPYLLLTLIVSLIGVYVVTRLVTGTLRERLTNQLLEAGRVVSDNFVRLEVQHVLDARRIIYTEGLEEALQKEDRKLALSLVEPYFGASERGALVLVSWGNREFLHLTKDAQGNVEVVQQETGATGSPIVTPFLYNRNVEEPPRRALGGNMVNNEVYYYTALPISSSDGEFLGVVVVGTPIKSLMPFLKNVALADVVMYDGNGQAIATTLGLGNVETLAALSIPFDEYDGILRSSEKIVTGNNFTLDNRDYTIGRAPLQVGSDRIGVFGVILPLDFVVESGENSRNTYVVLFSVLMILVIVIGVYVVSRSIINPLFALVRTSQAIAGGDLTRRTGLKKNDEIGDLAGNFDEMTARLQERTEELERMNEMLRQMDRTKTNFIQISAHELRTPLTLIMGYSQMLEQDTHNDPEMLKLTQGILEGSERMKDVVDSMLDVSRIDSDALTLRKVNLSLDMIISKVHKSFEGALKERSISIKTDGLKTLPAVPADPELIQKTFYHLIMNAIKYTPDGGSITITGTHVNGAHPPQAQVAIHDTGIGIDPSMHEAIFRKFHQAGEVLMHSSGKTKFKGGGPGLGLAIARGIVNAHGGDIRVESPGHSEETFPGSTFIVTLPLEEEGEA
jgi:signal transduction histidine kinase